MKNRLVRRRPLRRMGRTRRVIAGAGEHRTVHNRSQPFTSLDRILDGKGEFTENILYQIVSLLQGQVEIKPAAHQYSDDLTHLSGLKHIDYRKQFLYQPVMDTRDDCCER